MDQLGQFTSGTRAFLLVLQRRENGADKWPSESKFGVRGLVEYVSMVISSSWLQMQLEQTTSFDKGNSREKAKAAALNRQDIRHRSLFTSDLLPLLLICMGDYGQLSDDCSG